MKPKTVAYRKKLLSWRYSDRSEPRPVDPNLVPGSVADIYARKREAAEDRRYKRKFSKKKRDENKARLRIINQQLPGLSPGETG